MPPSVTGSSPSPSGRPFTDREHPEHTPHANEVAQDATGEGWPERWGRKMRLHRKIAESPEGETAFIFSD